MLDLTGLSVAELSALTKAMHEARFPEVWDDPIVWLNPFVIDLHVAATEEQRRRLVEAGDVKKMEGFDLWLRRPTRAEYSVFKSRLAEDDRLKQRVAQEGVTFVRWALRPYILDDDTAAGLVDYASRPTQHQPDVPMTSFSVRFRLSLQRALWGMIRPSLRAVAMGWEGDVGRARFIFDRAPGEDERELIAEVETEVVADFGEETVFHFTADFAAEDKLALRAGEDWWAFRRA